MPPFSNLRISRYHRWPGFVLRLGLLLVVLWATAGVSVAHGEHAQWVSVEDLRDLLRRIDPVVVDLRTPGEFDQGHWPGAVNVPIEALRREPSLLDAYREKSVLLYCRTVNKTGWAIRILEGRGFKVVYALRGGYEAVKRRHADPVE